MKAQKFDMGKLDSAIGMLEGIIQRNAKTKGEGSSDHNYYVQILGYMRKVKEGILEGKPVVAFMPPVHMDEILTAMDIVPIMAPLYSYLLYRGDETEVLGAARQYGLGPELCSAHRSQVGAALTGYLPPIAAYVWSNIPCDAIGKSSEVLADIMGCPGFFLDRGYSFEESELIYLTSQYEELVKFLEKATGQKMDWGKLEKNLELTKQTVALEKEIAELRKNVPAPMGNRGSMFMHVMNQTMPGRNEGVEFHRILRDECKRRVEKGTGAIAEEKYRLLMYFLPPQWGWRLLDWMEREHGAVFVAEPCVTTYFGSVKEIDGSPLEALAIKSMTRAGNYQLNGPVEYAVRSMIDGAREYKAEGVITFDNLPCVNSRGSNRVVKDALMEQAGIPFCSVMMDFGDPTVVTEEEMKASIESFLEVLDERKR